jgi:hypothetical protein
LAMANSFAPNALMRPGGFITPSSCPSHTHTAHAPHTSVECATEGEMEARRVQVGAVDRCCDAGRH